MTRRKPKMGRPPLPKGTAKGSVLSIRLSPSEREAIDRAAAAAGVKASEWARHALLASTHPIQ